MPSRDEPVSEAQRRAMGAAQSGHSNLGIPKSVGKEFIEKDPGGKLPERSQDEIVSSNILGGAKNFGMPNDDEGTSEGARKAAQTRAAGGGGFKRPGKPIQTTYHQSGGYRHPGTSEFMELSQAMAKKAGDQDPPPSAISGLTPARDQPAYKQAGPENLTLEAIQKKNRQYWAPDWAKRGDR